MSQEIKKPLIKKFKKLTNPRITPLEGEWHKSISQEYNIFKRFSDNKIINIFKTIARHPKLMKNWFPFFSYILNKSRLPKRDMEILILRIGWLCQSEYEWAQHSISAKDVGLTEEEIDRIIKDPEADSWSQFERTLIRAVDELYTNAIISNNTWKMLSETYDYKKMMDLIFTVGQYNLISMFLNTIGVQLEEGKKGFPE
ncbi:MAG: carboxymuconolactone decarboxylase family protein [Candidatus Thorarchaeota archaeon]